MLVVTAVRRLLPVALAESDLRLGSGSDAKSKMSSFPAFGAARGTAGALTGRGIGIFADTAGELALGAVWLGRGSKLDLAMIGSDGATLAELGPLLTLVRKLAWPRGLVDRSATSGVDAVATSATGELSGAALAG